MAESIRVYTDEHIGAAIVAGIRRGGINVLTFREAGLVSAPDQQHLRRATSEGRAVLTRDADFLRLHSMGEVHAGILYAPWKRTARQIIARVIQTHALLKAEDMIGHVEYL